MPKTMIGLYGCSECGNVSDMRRWAGDEGQICPICGFEHHDDDTSAIEEIRVQEDAYTTQALDDLFEVAKEGKDA